MSATKVGHALARGLGIKLNYRNELDDEIRRGESVFSSQTADTYVEQEPHAIDWVKDVTPNGQDLRQYLWSLFPFLHWISRYNAQWFAGDMVAGKHCRGTTLLHILTVNQVSQSVLLSSLRVWHMLFSLNYHRNTVFTHPSWVS